MAISADSREDSLEFLEYKQIKVPLLADPKLAAIKAWGVAMEGEEIAVPATFIVSQDKIIQWKYVGENMTDRPGEEEILKIARGLK